MPARGISRSAGLLFVTVEKGHLASMPPFEGACAAKRLILFDMPTSLGAPTFELLSVLHLHVCKPAYDSS